jgi:hypothetical protein
MTPRQSVLHSPVLDEQPTKARPKLSARLKELFDKYGQLALTIYFVLFGLVFVGFMLAIRFGVQVRGVAGGAGLVGAAWVATKLTQPIRILATLALVPVVARLRRRPQ